LAAVFALLALMLAPFLVLSGAIVGLATLSQGAREGLKVIFLAALICAVVLYGLFNQVTPVAGYLVTVWGPIWGAALLLRRSANQGAALLLNGAVVGLYTLLFRGLVDDVGGWWQAQLEAFGNSLAEQGGSFLKPQELEMIAGMAHSFSLVVFSLFLVVMLLLARWLQALVYNPNGFRPEFHTLILPRIVSPIAALVAVGALVQVANGINSGLASDFMIILVVLFAVQGLAIVHHRVAKQKLSVAWLVGLYVLLAFIPHFVGTGLAVVGIGDTFADFRGCRHGTSAS
jgi:hypothetical protein